MIGVDDIGVIPVKKVWRENPILQANHFSLPVPKKIVINFHRKEQPVMEEIFPMDQWQMPQQPQRYIKCDHDFF